jgi:lipid A 3-O-deacylase
MYLKKLCSILLLTMFFTPSQSEKIETPEVENEYSFFSGTFDTIDKEGDDKSTLIGIEHNNTGLFRNTFLGKFSPVTGAFISGKNSVYLYTGVQAQYDLGPLKVIPSFAPGYYDAGNGKDLGSVLEFKSEIKFNFNIFKDTKIGYSYSHISNNDWGTRNPGIDNKQISLSKNF